MAPKMQLMPGLRMNTRPSNKDKHPGLVLLGNPRRTSEEANQLREEVEKQREAEERRLTEAIESVAQIEDKRREQEEALELERRQRRGELRQ
jgi:predicted aconitase